MTLKWKDSEKKNNLEKNHAHYYLFLNFLAIVTNLIFLIFIQFEICMYSIDYVYKFFYLLWGVLLTIFNYLTFTNIKLRTINFNAFNDISQILIFFKDDTQNPEFMYKFCISVVFSIILTIYLTSSIGYNWNKKQFVFTQITWAQTFENLFVKQIQSQNQSIPKIEIEKGNDKEIEFAVKVSDKKFIHKKIKQKKLYEMLEQLENDDKNK